MQLVCQKYPVLSGCLGLPLFMGGLLLFHVPLAIAGVLDGILGLTGVAYCYYQRNKRKNHETMQQLLCHYNNRSLELEEYQRCDMYAKIVSVERSRKNTA